MVTEDTKISTVKDFHPSSFDNLSSCTEYIFQVNLLWNPPDGIESNSNVIASVTSDPFVTLPSNATIQLKMIKSFQDSITFEVTGTNGKILTKMGLFMNYVTQNWDGGVSLDCTLGHKG